MSDIHIYIHKTRDKAVDAGTAEGARKAALKRRLRQRSTKIVKKITDEGTSEGAKKAWQTRKSGGTTSSKESTHASLISKGYKYVGPDKGSHYYTHPRTGERITLNKRGAVTKTTGIGALRSAPALQKSK